MPAVFDDDTLRKLEQLALVARRVRVGVMKGDRRSRKRGSSVEFADYRDYVQGDDLRRLDWNIFARLERPFIKLLEEEEDLAVHLLLDASASMDWPAGQDETNKWRYALTLAGALGYVALGAGDRLHVALLGGHVSADWGPHRGRHNSLSLLQFLDKARASGTTDLNAALRGYSLRARRPGLAFLLSDLFSPAGFKEGLQALQARGFEAGVIHLLSPDEVAPPLAGDVRLLDVETGGETEISIDGATAERYGRYLDEWQAEIAAFCRQRQIHYVPVVTDVPWDTLVMRTMRRQGMVR